jgi:probable phosphoglycerate mutase
VVTPFIGGHAVSMAHGEIYLVRHAEAGGHHTSDPALSRRGVDQARAMGDRLAGAIIGPLLHSPRRRAQQTAAIMAGSLPGVPVSVSDLIDDRTPIPSESQRDAYPRRFLPWLDATCPDEADVDGVALTRAVDVLAERAVAEAERGPLVLVTHAFVIGWFVRSALDAPAWRWLGLQPANASLTVVRYDADRTGMLVRFNDHAHLGGRVERG